MRAQMKAKPSAQILTMSSLVSHCIHTVKGQVLIRRATDARWYTRNEIVSVLSHPLGGIFGSAEYKKMAESTEGRTNDDKHLDPAFHLTSPDDPPFRLPPPTAIAGVLIRDWVDGKIGFTPATTLQKGYL